MGAENSACLEAQCPWDQWCNGKTLYTNRSSSGVKSKISRANRAYQNFFSSIFPQGKKKKLKSIFNSVSNKNWEEKPGQSRDLEAQPGKREASSRERHATCLLEEQLEVETPTVNFLAIHSGTD